MHKIQSILFLILFCLTSVCFAIDEPGSAPPSIPTERAMAASRDQVMEALKANDFQIAEQFLDEHPASKKSILLTSIEYIQLALYIGRYEEALALWANALSVERDVTIHPNRPENVSKNILYTKCMHSSLCAVDDLSDFLNEFLDFNDSASTVRILKKVRKAEVSQETKDLAKVLISLAQFAKARTRYQKTIFSPGHHEDAHISVLGYPIIYPPKEDELQQIVQKVSTFITTYPNSPATKHASTILVELQHAYIYATVNNATTFDKLYTGGIGVEFFISRVILHDAGEFFIAVPIQKDVLIFTPFFGGCESGERLHTDDDKKNDDNKKLYPKWENVGMTLGLDLYDSKRLKFQPFVGGAFEGPVMLGSQLDFRFLMESRPGEFGVMAYLSLKARFSIEWLPGNGFYSNFGLGIGAHFW